LKGKKPKFAAQNQMVGLNAIATFKKATMNKYLANLHQGAIPSTHKFANELRHRSTEAEQILWSLLRNRKVKGKKFRRQHAIAQYVANFYCHECRLIIELEGHHHKKPGAKEYD
jgi:very-short-patch-repair endonuclease